MTGRATGALLAAILLVAAPEALAQQPQVTVRAERSAVQVGEPFWVTVTVQSETGGASISLPPGSPFQLLRHGGTSSSFQMRSGFGLGTQITRTETIRWQVSASRPGRQVLGPLTVRVAGQQLSAGVTTVEVSPAGALPPGGTPLPPGGPQPMPPQPMPPGSGFPTPGYPPQPAPMAPPPGTSPSGLPGAIDPAELGNAVYDPELFVRTVVEPPEAFVGQQVLVTVYLYTTLNLSNVNVTREPSTDGFWSEDLLGPTRRLEFEDQLVGSTHFRVAVLRRLALFPLREGRLAVGPPELEARTVFTSLFSGRGGTLSRRGTEAVVQVRPLPSSGRPDDFESGNVGRYSITSSVDRASVKVGEPVTLTVTVRGDGNLRNVKIAPLGEIPGARVYEPRVRDSVAPGGGSKVVSGEKSWEYLVLAQEAGTLDLPEATIAYFDPIAGRYQSKRAAAVKVHVTGGAAAAGGPTPRDPQVATSGEVEQVGPLRSIRRRSSLATRHAPLQESWWFLLLLAAAPLGFLALFVAQGIRRRRVASRDVLVARRAASVARKALRQVGQGTGAEGHAAVARAVNRYLSERFGEPTAGLTRDELRSYLAERGAGEELSVRVADLIEACERARYAPGGSDGGAEQLAPRAEALVVELDRVATNGSGGGKR